MDVELSCPECNHRVIMTRFRANKGEYNIHVCVDCGTTFRYDQEKDELIHVQGETDDSH